MLPRNRNLDDTAKIYVADLTPHKAQLNLYILG